MQLIGDLLPLYWSNSNPDPVILAFVIHQKRSNADSSAFQNKSSWLFDGDAAVTTRRQKTATIVSLYSLGRDLKILATFYFVMEYFSCKVTISMLMA